jgi:uncharacterized membrane protein YheB (UPF0754 family)|tara:strand:- start:300 stop:518 length:219 start_codon:yes stop_codon:yes gene_type:complete
MNDNDMEATDKKVNEVANDNLDALEDSLKHMESEEIKKQIDDMLDDCLDDKKTLIKVAKILINKSRESFEDE